MRDLQKCYLYTFVDTAYLRGRNPADLARQLCEGGADVIQLRAKGSTPEQVEAMARAILPITRDAGVVFVVNDYPRVANKVEADLCHLGQEDFFDSGYTHVSQLWTDFPKLGIGLSTHAPSQAERALEAKPAYIAVGPVYATDTKPGAKPVTVDYVRWAAKNVRIPWFAIGGINLKNIDAVLEAGAKRICVVSAILNTPDPITACRKFADKVRPRPAA